MDRIKSKSIGVFLPAFAKEFVSSEAAEGLEPLSEVISGHEVSEVSAKLRVAVIVKAMNSRFFDGSIHTFHLAVGPRMIGLGEAMIDGV